MDWPRFAKRLLLADGRITAVEAEMVRRAVLADEKVTREEVEFLIDLKRSASAVHPTFDQFLFDVLKQVVLVDDRISDAEAAWLEKAVFANQVLASEAAVRFLTELKAAAEATGPRFEKLYATWAGKK